MNTPLSLSGTWDLRLDGDADWRPVAVPGCWEQAGVAKDHSGPAWYRTQLLVPPAFSGQRLWLRFGAVSYHCEVFVDGQLLGSHTGLWDSFTIEISAAVTPGQPAELMLRVEKPAGLTGGPDSASLPGRFPLRETLAGFLPYVWGHIFGGIWQDVALVATGANVFTDLHVRGAADGCVTIEGSLAQPGVVEVEIRDPQGELLLASSIRSDDADAQPRPSSFALSQQLASPHPWSPGDPALYEARLRVADGDERVLRFGLRSLRAEGAALLLNERPIYPRMALSWGWYHESLHSNPGPERVRADFARLKALGYNGVKLCLWFPPQYYFDLADELGMLLWVELPMWLPRPSAFFRAQTPIEYERLMRQARNHPSVILYSLGCELNDAIDSALLAPLYAMAKAQAGDALLRDNSGSGEAYGGLLNEFAEYYDYHFYCELPFMRGLLDSFSPRWRPQQPWVFGEFCDYDTFRLPIADSRLQTKKTNLPSPVHDRPLPWWLRDDPELNPQGARWLYEVVAHEQRLRANGMWERGAELERISERQGLLHRKYTLELVRMYQEICGYVVTGEADTPISTAGMWDAADRLKFDPAAFRASNADLVVLVGWDRRRAWVAGGDRAAAWDTWSYASGANVRAHLVASNYSTAAGTAQLRWSAAFPGEPPFAAGEITTPFALGPGTLRELTIAEFHAPTVAQPRALTLSTDLAIGAERAHNSWLLWVFPQDPWHSMRNIGRLDPSGRLADLAQLAPEIAQWPPASAQDPAPAAVVATAWTPELAAFVERGGRALLLQAGAAPAGPLPMVEMPFWREALRLAAPHPAWRDFPLDDAMGLQFFGCSTDYALDLAGYAGEWWPIFRRLDARTMYMHEYAAELRWGAGRLIVTTLRCEGGQGAQPLGLARNTAAAYLLRCWADYLARAE